MVASRENLSESLTNAESAIGAGLPPVDRRADWLRTLTQRGEMEPAQIITVEPVRIVIPSDPYAPSWMLVRSWPSCANRSSIRSTFRRGK